MSCTSFDQLVEAVAKKKGCRQAQVESTGHKNHRQNKRATVEKNSARCSGGGRSPATPRPWPTAVVPKGPQPRAFFSELLPAGVDNKHIAVMNSSCLRAGGHLPHDLLAILGPLQSSEEKLGASSLRCGQRLSSSSSH